MAWPESADHKRGATANYAPASTSPPTPILTAIPDFRRELTAWDTSGSLRLVRLPEARVNGWHR